MKTLMAVGFICAGTLFFAFVQVAWHILHEIGKTDPCGPWTANHFLLACGMCVMAALAAIPLLIKGTEP